VRQDQPCTSCRRRAEAFSFPLSHGNSNFQYQLAEKELPEEQHIYQSIFLNTKNRHLWTKDEIDPSKIIREDWWFQICHSWTHYVFVVPWMFLLNWSGKRHTKYAGAATLVNAHEVALISGMATAYALGAPYPEDLEQDKFALLCFRCAFLSGRSLKSCVEADFGRAT
jgi:hypothetical protein